MYHNKIKCSSTTFKIKRYKGRIRLVCVGCGHIPYAKRKLGRTRKIPRMGVPTVSRSPMQKILSGAFVLLVVILLATGKTELTYKAVAAEPVSIVTPATGSEKPCTPVSSGYGGCLAPQIANKRLSDLSGAERTMLREAQRAHEGSTVKNNPYGIKYGGSTKKWVEQGLATIGTKALDGGRFLHFKSVDIADQAYDDLLYHSGVYAGMTVHQAMRIWTGHSNEVDQ